MNPNLRLLYLPNEGIEGDQIGPRRAFERFHAEGGLSAYQAYSYLARASTLGNHRTALVELLNTAREFAPDVIFIQHMTDSYPVDRAYLQQLKALPSRPRLVLWEGDAYGRYIKKLDASLRAVMDESDITFLVGLGYLADAAKAAGATRIRLAPHSYDSVRFDLPWEPPTIRPLDAVMIANLHSIKRIPGLYLPGGRQRKKLAHAFHQSLGDRFAVYGGGAGWKRESYARGPIAFHQQSDMIRSAWMSVAWDHFDELPMYSSDRLPISLACGVPHLTNYQPGYELVFGGIPGLYWFHTPQEAVDIALYLLSMPQDQRIELGMAAAAHVRERFHADKVYGDMLKVIEEELFAGRDWVGP
ncbi:MAG: glycosyltransferase family 1 protein [Sulfuriferula multivorans]|uniref:Glycosyltransferase family 1 protein n=1 Tax=Sulfuriferula multivorans TaxID=1559896 RepID=A0A7C9K8Q5_9PROT|nr:glycosyltransferase family 1 protein [Sulfuriferula multivorans]